MTSSARFLPALLLALAAAACGADEGEAPDAAPPEEAAIGQEPEGSRLQGEDLEGLDGQDVVFNLPWVPGPVNREATGDGEAAPVEEVAVTEGGAFDRVVFRLGEGQFPGYHLAWAEEPAAECESGDPAPVEGDRQLRIVLDAEPASPVDGRPRGGLVLTCATPGELEWHLGAAASAQVRVIEMRDPLRLVVDVRNSPGGGTGGG